VNTFTYCPPYWAVKQELKKKTNSVALSPRANYTD
jgi:hypothetical protein